MKYLVFAFSVICVIFASCSSENEQEHQAIKGTPIKVAVTPTIDCLPLFVAKEIGLDEELGLNLYLKNLSSKADCDSALIGGSVEGILSDYVRAEYIKQNWIKLRIEYVNAKIKEEAKLRKGKKRINAKDNQKRIELVRKSSANDSLYIFPHENMPMFLFTNSKSRIREGKQLVDKVIGVDRQGADAVMARLLLDSVKISDEKAFLVQMQNYNIRQKMILNNTLDAAVVIEPYATQLRKAKHRSIYSCKKLKGKTIGCLLTNGKAANLRELYNRACDSINHNGIHHYDSVMVKYFNIPSNLLQDIPVKHFSKL